MKPIEHFSRQHLINYFDAWLIEGLGFNCSKNEVIASDISKYMTKSSGSFFLRLIFFLGVVMIFSRWSLNGGQG